MPSKKKQQPIYSIDPALYTRSLKPACTVAMGMKCTQASSHCWVAQVEREGAIRERWMDKYDPERTQEAEREHALQRHLSRTAERKAEYVDRAANPELHTILYSKTSVGNVQHNNDVLCGRVAGRSGPVSEEERAAAAEAQRVAQAADVSRPSRRYLDRRYNEYTLPQRFPRGPATAAQTVGWAAALDATKTAVAGKAAAAGSSSSSPNAATAATAGADGDAEEQPSIHYPAIFSRKRVLTQAYHKPEDDDHALLFGYDLQPK